MTEAGPPPSRDRPAPPWQVPPERILVRGVNWLGDAVMSTPALLRLRAALPQAHLTLLTPEKLGGLWEKHPALDSVLTFTPRESLWRVARRLRREGFDLSLILPNSPRSALESFFAGIPIRIGYGGAWRRVLLTHPVAGRAGAVRMRKRSKLWVKALARWAPAKPRFSPPASAHHIHQYLHLAASIGAESAPLPPRLFVEESEVKAVLEKFGIESALPARPLLGLNPGAEYGPAKRWPQDRFAGAALALQRQTQCRWILFGGRADLGLASEIAAWLESVAAAHPGATRTPGEKFVWNLAGQTSLRELGALLKACRVLLTNDTGPMHVAAALGTPVVAPFGSTSPELTGPGLLGESRHRLLLGQAPCAPCFLRECPIDFRCMTSITVEQITAAVRSCLEPS